MKILFALNHPAHFHLFKCAARELGNNNHDLLFVYKQKDLLEDLLKYFEFKSKKISKRISTSNLKASVILGRLTELVKQDISLFKVVQEFNPELMVGTDISITHIGRIKGIPSIVFNEDDIEINKLFCYSAYPFTNHIVCPILCNTGKFSYKKISYNGYQKLAYLHPKRFTPDKSIVKNYIPFDKPYYLLRLVSFTAGHDVEQNHSGITNTLLGQIIDIFCNHGNVYLSSELPLKKEFIKYQLLINPSDIHHFLYYADLVVADSQSVIIESAILGTPSIRYNSFVGKISVLEELEDKYSLTYGVHSGNPDKLLAKIDELLKINDLKEIFRKRQKLMIKDKIDLTSFIVWLIEKYPLSIKIMRDNPEYQEKFK